MGTHILRWLVLAAIVWTVHCQRRSPKPKKPNPSSNSCRDACGELETLKQAVIDLSRQVLMLQTAAEERARLNSYSGVHVVRSTKRGPRNYNYAAHLSPAAISIHDHSNYQNTVGIGEFTATLNGVTFRTRHNDYKISKPSTKSKAFHAYEEIPYPDVPPEVLREPTIEGQIKVMREYFQAFQDQDPSVRDYRKYFKPVFCYLEGAWTTDTKNLDEPFPSDRHSMDAKTTDELEEKFRFTANTGVKHRLENVAFLPRGITSFNDSTGYAVYAQWNYRILCHPVDFDLKLSNFKQQDDLLFRQATGQTLEEVGRTRAARYLLSDTKTETANYQLIDKIFNSIPGKDNYGAKITMTVFGEPVYDPSTPQNTSELNFGYYRRSYVTSKNGAGGIAQTFLGFNDADCWVALTTQDRVAPFKTDKCWLITNEYGKLATRCKPGELRTTYAIPLEVIYLNPLQRWNPYNLAYYDDATTTSKDNRNGDAKKYEAFNGTDKTHYYRTPNEFFTGDVDKSDPADTTRNYVHVLDPNGVPRRVSASGIRIVLPEIKGIGFIRQRYVISPLAYEGSTVSKELNAFKDSVQSEGVKTPTTVQFEMSVTVQDPPGEHTHAFSISVDDYFDLQSGLPVNVTTFEAQGHTHDLTLVYSFKDKKFKYTLCDGAPFCNDGHGTTVYQKSDPNSVK